MEDYNTRETNLKEFISTLTNINRINIVEIKNWDDMNKYAQDPEYEGLVVSQETYENAVKLSETREKIGLEPLILIVIPIFKDKNNQKLSSTSIRKKL